MYIASPTRTLVSLSNNSECCGNLVVPYIMKNEVSLMLHRKFLPKFLKPRFNLCRWLFGCSTVAVKQVPKRMLVMELSAFNSMFGAYYLCVNLSQAMLANQRSLKSARNRRHLRMRWDTIRLYNSSPYVFTQVIKLTSHLAS